MYANLLQYYYRLELIEGKKNAISISGRVSFCSISSVQNATKRVGVRKFRPAGLVKSPKILP
jgi:hypothetical protein